jgi:[acyl-carrier-protein] S-malonyltransferase
MLNDGVDMFIECGPGKTLSGLIRRISSAARAYVCDDDASFTGTVWEVIVNAER